MNKSELIDAVARRTGQTQVASAAIVNAALDLLGQALAEGESVQLSGFGSFHVGTRAARTGRNPATGEPIMLAEAKGVRFAPGKPLKDRLNPVAGKGAKGK
uniref:HU family DNA-binding protein n=1 Tax=Burkholderia arboris TaxID=488730 RepID=UPI003BEEE1BA